MAYFCGGSYIIPNILTCKDNIVIMLLCVPFGRTKKSKSA